MANEITWKARPAQFRDLAGISSLRKMFLDEAKGSVRRSCEQEYYEWKCYQNAVHQGQIVIAEDGETVVGMASITPKPIRFLTKPVFGAEIGDTFTHPFYQRQGIFTTLVNLIRQIAQEMGVEFIYGTPNEDSLPGYEKKLDFGMISMVSVNNLVRPVDIAAVLRLRLESRWLANLLTPIIGFGYSVVSRFAKRKSFKGQFLLSEVSTFPDNIGVLFEQVSTEYDFILMRDWRYLEWRFVRNPDRYAILLAIDAHRDRVLGYVVSKIGTWRGLRVGYIADFLTVEDDPGVFISLVLACINSFRKKGVQMVSCWAVRSGFYDRVLRRIGFLAFKHIPIICLKNDLGREVLTRTESWHFTMADSDNI